MNSIHRYPKKKDSSPFAALFVIVFTMIVLTGVTGCIDVNFTKNVVEHVQEDEDIKRADNLILSKPDQEFEIEIQGGQTPSTEDLQRIGTKLFENLTNPDQDTPDDLRMILQEENITLKPKIYHFYIVRNTDRLYVSVDPTFAAIGSPPVGGYFEIVIMNATGDVVVYEERVQTENKKETPYNFFPPKASIDEGKWTVELRGTGLQSPGSLFYSGKFDLEVHAHEPV